MGRNHARVYRELGNGVILVAVADQDEQQAASVGGQMMVPHYADYREMLDQHQPDLISLAVPTLYHCSIGLDVMARGVHVLVEKPIAGSLNESEQLIEAADKDNVILAVGHIERFNPAVRELVRQLKDGMAGRIFSVMAHRLSPYPTRVRDCGVVLDLATHDIDLMRYLVPESIERLYCETIHSFDGTREDMFNGLMRFSNGVVGVLDVNWITPAKVRRLTVTGARGMFVCDLLSQELWFYENETAPSRWDTLSILRGVSEGNVLGIRIQRYEPLKAELQDFVEAVQQGRPPMVTGHDGHETLRVALAFIQSGETAQII